VKAICSKHNWREERLNSLEVIAKLSGLSTPEVDRQKTFKVLEIKPLSHIKWDARAGNAIFRNDRGTCWFDWEHCGRRAGIDDLVWFYQMSG
jgi:hypothetical protein